MKILTRALLATAALVFVLTPVAALAKSGPTVTVRVEGLTKTLLAPKTVHVPTSGSITKGGTPKGACSARTATGALDVATKHHWNGLWDAKYQALEITSVFGEAHGLKSPNYWSIWVNGRYAMSGLCGLTLHRGDQLLLAAVSDSFSGSPLILRTSSRQARIGATVTVTAGYLAKNGFTPAAGVKLMGAGTTVATGKDGKARFTIAHAGTLVVRGAGTGFIRSAPLKIIELP